MASLNTLRTKGGVVVAVVIGLSLLAFLLGDFAQTGGAFMGSSNMNVGIVDSHKISVQDLTESIDEVTLVQQMLTGAETQNEQETQAIRTQAWDRLVRNIIFTPGLQKLGLVVSEAEQVDMAAGRFTSPVLSSIFVNQQTGLYDREMVKNFVASIQYDNTGRSSKFWDYIEGEMAEERAFSKFFSLASSAMVVTDVEVEQLTALNNIQSSINYITRPIYALADSLVKVSDADLKAYYNSHLASFKTLANRDIEYVVFDALPSEKDYAQAKKEVDELAADFANAQDVPQFVTLNSATPFDATYKVAAEFGSEIAEYINAKKRENIYGPVMESDVYTIAKVLDSKMLPDTLGAKHILLSAENSLLADSLVKVLRRDRRKFAALANEFSLDQNANRNGGDLGEFDMNQMVPEFSNAIAASKKGDILTVRTQFGIHVVEVTKVGPKQRKYQVAELTYNVNPSSQTQQAAYAQATSFMKSSSNGDFDKAVSEGGFSKRSARLRAGDRDVQGIVGSSELVRWAFDNKAGAISTVVSVGDANYVAKVVMDTEHGVAPLDKVKSEVRSAVLREKKVEYLAKQIEGETTLEAMAKKLNVEVGSADDVNLGLYYIPGIGVAPEVIGAVTAVKEGEISKPIGSASALTVVKVNKQASAENVTAENEKALLESAATQMADQRAMGSIYTLADIQDMRIKFF